MSIQQHGFKVTLPDGRIIRFEYYSEEAPLTIAAFRSTLPFQRVFLHARVSGMEIWTDKAPLIEIPQENATVFTEAGEVVIGPHKPQRVKTAGCMGIYYGEGKGLDAANVFAKVLEEDLRLLQTLGEEIWKHGSMQLQFSEL